MLSRKLLSKIDGKKQLCSGTRTSPASPTLNHPLLSSWAVSYNHTKKVLRVLMAHYTSLQILFLHHTNTIITVHHYHTSKVHNVFPTMRQVSDTLGLPALSLLRIVHLILISLSSSKLCIMAQYKHGSNLLHYILWSGLFSSCLHTHVTELLTKASCC